MLTWLLLMSLICAVMLPQLLALASALIAQLSSVLDTPRAPHWGPTTLAPARRQTTLVVWLGRVGRSTLVRLLLCLVTLSCQLLLSGCGTPRSWPAAPDQPGGSPTLSLPAELMRPAASPVQLRRLAPPGPG